MIMELSVLSILKSLWGMIDMAEINHLGSDTFQITVTSDQKELQNRLRRDAKSTDDVIILQDTGEVLKVITDINDFRQNGARAFRRYIH